MVTWSRVMVPATHFDRVVRSLRHVGTTVEFHGDDDVPRRRGQALWASTDEPAGRIGIAFDWGEMSTSTPTLADPMAVISNVLFTGADGVPLDDGQQIVYLNTVIHEIPWQASVMGTQEVRGRTLWVDMLPKAA
jgi:hypothetical protein